VPRSPLRDLTAAESVHRCAYLSEDFRRRFRMPEISWKRVVRMLKSRKISFVLTGAYGIAYWSGEPRSTYDVDILVKSGRNYVRAIKAMKDLYPELEMRNLFGVAAFFVPGERRSVIDVTYPHRDDIAETLKTAIWFDVEGLRVRIPTLETALANKYGAMLALNREEVKRVQDGVDFTKMVLVSLNEGRTPIDLERLAELGELAWPGGGGKEIVELVEKAKAGHVPRPTARAEELST
jgi:hypothetical protein